MIFENTDSQQQRHNSLMHSEHQIQGPNHHRSTSGLLKRNPPAHQRAARTAPITKRSAHLGLSKATRKPVPPKSDSEESDEPATMASSFLQFCATCENQIFVPNNSLLYCSDKCRRADKHSYTYDYTPPTSPLSRASLDEPSHRDIVPLRSPTTIKPSSYPESFSLSTSLDRADSVMQHQPQESEAARYLRQFQSSAMLASEAARYLQQFRSGAFTYERRRQQQRPRFERTHVSAPAASGNSSSAAPSLCHTPTSSSSFAMPGTPSQQRPLPPRAHPYSTSAGARIDLVTPLQPCAPGSVAGYYFKSAPSAPTATPAAAIAEDVAGTGGRFVYEKREPVSLAGAGAGAPGSLRQLFAFDAVRAPPLAGELAHRLSAPS